MAGRHGDLLMSSRKHGKQTGGVVKDVSAICLGSAGEDGYNGRAGEEQSGQVPEGAETVVRPGRRPGASAIVGLVAGTVSSVA